MFKKKRSIKLNYIRQGFVYFWCANYGELSLPRKKGIDGLCEELGGRDALALKILLISPERSVKAISINYLVTEKRLYDLRAKFYEEFWRRKLWKI